MWLDRFGGQSHPSPSPSPSQPASRSFSPLPRRTSSTFSPYVTSHRPASTPRGSYTSLVSNDSSTSLLASSRRPNGSSLKQSHTAHDGPDPVEILSKILGKGGLRDGDTAEEEFSITAKDLGLDWDFEGASLRDFASADDEEGPGPTRRQTVDECMLCYFLLQRVEILTFSWYRRERQNQIRRLASLDNGMRRRSRFG